MAEIGIEFPRDYRSFVDQYGSVRFRGDLLLWAPSVRKGPRGFENFVKNCEFVTEDILLAYEDREDEIPFQIFPEVGGILPWANNSKGDFCFWHTAGPNPDSWPVVVWIQEDLQWDVLDLTATDFMADIVMGSYGRLGSLLPNSFGADLSWEHEGEWNWAP